MSACILTWNPNRSSFDDLRDFAREVLKEPQKRRWSCGVTKSEKKIGEGDRAFLLRQVVEPRGIVGSGEVVRSPYPDDHWKEEGKVANYVDVRFDVFLIPEVDQILGWEKLVSHPDLSDAHWETQSSGITISDEKSEILESVWANHIRDTGLKFAGYS